MIKLFQNEKYNILIFIHLSESELSIKDKLENWLRNEYEEIYYVDIEMHDGGSVEINYQNKDIIEIVFYGDNGLIVFYPVKVHSI